MFSYLRPCLFASIRSKREHLNVEVILKNRLWMEGAMGIPLHR